MNYELNIAVCLKQVPDTAAMQLDPVTHTLRRDGVKAVLNPLDEFPLEAAVRLKRAVGGSVTAFTMGPPQADAVIPRRSFAIRKVKHPSFSSSVIWETIHFARS